MVDKISKDSIIVTEPLLSNDTSVTSSKKCATIRSVPETKNWTINSKVYITYIFKYLVTSKKQLGMDQFQYITIKFSLKQ